jgi:hypothetical protein
MIGICHRLEDDFGPSTHLATIWAPSGYLAIGTALKPARRVKLIPSGLTRLTKVLIRTYCF